ncbi:MAG: DUF1643 domain-containing protein [Ruminococcus sp.]|nr:DUF1643 domain-containing protein [Ruminococcus sp.]
MLSRIWDKEKPIALFITKSSGTANGIQIELTNNIITNNLYKLGYGGYHAVNLCSAINKSTVPQFDKTTDDVIKKYAKLSRDIIIAWGTLTTKTMKSRENEVLGLLIDTKKQLLTVCDDKGHSNVHPLTPSVRSQFILSPFAIGE